MLRSALVGVVAGAVGTVALNVATYLDMAVRGRSSSNAPTRMVSTVVDKAGLSLAPQAGESKDQVAQHRASGLGALLGYVNGIGTGIAYGLLRSNFDDVSIPLAAIGVGLSAMAASDVPIVLLGVSNPKTWGVSDWAADIIPHLVYGLATVTTYEELQNME